MAFIAYLVFAKFIKEKDIAKVAFRAKSVEALLEKSFQQNLEVVYSVQNLFFTHPDTTRQQFKDFVTNSLLRHSGLLAIEHMIRIEGRDRSKFEAQMQREGFANFTLKEQGSDGKMRPAAIRDHYYVLNFIEPLQENIAALGYDISFTPKANEALREAQSKGVGVSPWLQLAQGDLGFVVYLNIQKSEGMAVAVFRLKKFIEAAIGASQADSVDFVIEEVTDTPGVLRALKFNSIDGKIEPFDPSQLENLNDELVVTTMLSIGQRSWKMTHFPSAQFKSVIHPSIPYFAALTVLLLMLVVTFFIDEREARVTAETATKVREEFMTVASHELRTPLTPLKMEIFLVKELMQTGQFSQQKVMELLDNANKHLNHIVSLIDDLLDVGRISEEHYRYNFSEFKIDELIRSTVEKFEPVFKANNCSLQLNLQPDITVNWDAQRIEQVIANCLSNSVKFSNQAIIEVNLRAEGNDVIFAVKDNGIGISEEFQKKIFNKFERGVSSKSYGGLGIGLYIVHQIITAHRGSVRVISNPGAGSEFIFKVPRNV